MVDLSGPKWLTQVVGDDNDDDDCESIVSEGGMAERKKGYLTLSE